MELVAPDLVVIFGLRAVLSLVGILVILVSFWSVEKRWDEVGSAAYEKAQEAAEVDGYQAVDEDVKKYVTNADGSRDAISVSTEDNSQPDYVANPDITVPKEELEAAMPLPVGLIAGCAIWAFSFLFSSEGGFVVYAGWNLFFLVLLPTMGVVIAYPVRRSTIERDLDTKKKAITALLLSSMWLTGCGIIDKDTQAPWYLCFFGAVSLFFAYHIIRRSRKMGITWDTYGKPAFDISVQSLGPLTLIFGFFLFWVGTNAQEMAEGDSNYIPLYLNWRSLLVFVSGLGLIVPSLLALDFAFDEGSEPSGNFLDGRVFRELASKITSASVDGIVGILETQLFLSLGWILFGLSAFVPFSDGFTVQKIFACLLSVATGAVYGLKLLPSYWNADTEEHRKWLYIYYTFMVFLFTAVGVYGEGLLVMSMLAVIFILLGQHIEMLEKKRGKRWLQQRETNPDVTAFGMGHPICIVGWILLCVSMSVPM